MKIKPIKTIRIPERVDFLETSAGKNYCAFGNKTKCYVLGNDFEIISQFETPSGKNSHLVMHPNQPSIAIMGKDNTLCMVDINGKVLWTKHGEYIAVCWTLEGASLYTLIRINPHQLKLLIYGNSGELIAQKEFEDKLYESSAMITPIPAAREMTLQLMAGQDGCLLAFVSLIDGGITLRPLHKHYSYTCASFDSTGTVSCASKTTKAASTTSPTLNLRRLAPLNLM